MSAALDLRREAQADPLTIPGLDAIPDRERAAALTNWRDRMVSEHVSARVFGAFVGKLITAGAPRRHIVTASAAIAQELDHALLCARVVAALGGDPVAPLPEPLAAVPAHEDASPMEAVLRDAISIGCCSETVTVALVGTERELAGSPALEGLLATILADEVKHARLGWKLLEEAAPSLDARLRARLSAYLVAAFDHTIAFHAPFLAMPATSDRAASIGAPDGPGNWRTFVDTIEDVTVPGLERHGLEARRAWKISLDRVASRSAA